MKIEPGIQYIVTEDTPDGTFFAGDHIQLSPNGEILCKEATGWLSAEDSAFFLPKLKVEIDKHWAYVEMKRLQGKMANLTMNYGVDTPSEVKYERTGN